MAQRKIVESILVENTYSTLTSLAPFIIAYLGIVFVAIVLKIVHIPYQITAVALGMVTGTLISYFKFIKLKELVWLGPFVDALIFPIFLMKLLYTLDIYMLAKSWGQVLLIAFVTQFSSMFGVGLMVIKIFGSNLTMFNIVVAGIILIPNDVPEMMIELDSIKNLELLMHAESIFSLLLSRIVIILLVGVHLNIIDKWYQIIVLLIRYVLFGLLTGFVISFIVPLLYKHLYDDSINAIVIIISSAYGMYIVCERIFFCNGVLGVFILFMFLNPERSKLTSEVDQHVQNFINCCYVFMEVLVTTMYSSYIMVYVIKYFHFTQIFLAICIFIMIMIIRFFSLFIITPILSRIGYGFNFTSLITIFCTVTKGPIQLLYGIVIERFKLQNLLGKEILSTILYYVILNYVFNLCLLRLILRKCGIVKMSSTRQSNIINGFKIMEERQGRIISVMKMNRFFSDANWPIIQEVTKLKNPYKGTKSEDDFMYLYWTRQTICPNCTKVIPVEPTKNELVEMLREVRLRVLKAERISFIRQYEGGLLSKQEIKILLQAITIAVDSNDLEIKLDDLLKLFKKKHLIEKINRVVRSIGSDDAIKAPKQKIRRICYYISKTKTFEIIIYICIVLNLALVIKMIVTLYQVDSPLWEKILKWVFYLFYFVEFYIKLLALSGEGYRKGFKLYLRNHWNKLDFSLLILSFIDFVIIFITIFWKFNLSETGWATGVTCFRSIRFIRALRLLRIFSKFYPKGRYRFHMGFWALLIAYDETIELLPILAENEKIREIIKISLENDKLIIIKELGSLEKERPWMTVTVKTKQLINSTLVFMKNSVQELRYAGFVDNFEFIKLTGLIDKCVARAARYKIIHPVVPKSLFCEVWWMYNDGPIIEYLYDNVITKIWNANDIIISNGEKLEGVLVLVTGMFRMNYQPTNENLEALKSYGALPIKDYICNRRFSEPQVDFVVVGNSIGELSALTGRPYSCTITAFYPSQAFVIPNGILNEAFEMSKDPVNGVACRMWKQLSFNLARRILLETPMYQSMSHDIINSVLDRSIMPNISYFKVIVMCDVIEDVLLIEGLAVDYNTREIFTAPCYIPRTVKKMILPQSSSFSLKELGFTKLLIIPMKDVDVYNAMYQIETLSELVPGFQSSLSAWGLKALLKHKKKQTSMIFARKASSALRYSSQVNVTNSGIRSPQENSRMYLDLDLSSKASFSRKDMNER